MLKGVVMPFIVTEPQKIEGTQLGFSVYPYHFDFQDFVEKDRKFNRKLIIFKMKNSPYMEVDKVLFEEKFLNEEVKREFVNERLKSFISSHQEYVFDKEKTEKFFEKSVYKRDEKEKLF